MNSSTSDHLFSDEDRANFAKDVDHILRVVSQCYTEGQLNRIQTMVNGMMRKYTKHHGFLRHKRATIVNDDGLVFLYQKIFAQREFIRENDWRYTEYESLTSAV